MGAFALRRRKRTLLVCHRQDTMGKNSSTSFGIGNVTARPAAPTLTRRKSALVIRPMEQATFGALSLTQNMAGSQARPKKELVGILTVGKSIQPTILITSESGG